jgi:hypothetical protein
MSEKPSLPRLNRRNLLFFALKMLLAWSAITAVVVSFGGYLLTPLFPLFKAIIVSVVSEFSPSLQFIPATAGGQLKLSVWVLSGIINDNSVIIPKGLILTSTTHVLHSFVPITLALSIIWVWPTVNWRQKIAQLLLGLCGSLIILLLSVPVLLIALLEMPFQEKALAINSRHQAPWFMDWMIFSEMGGSLLLALLAAWICIHVVSAQFLQTPHPPQKHKA